MREVQQHDPFPYGDMLSVPVEKVTTFRQTSGTTGTPVYQACTWQDWEWWTECWSYILWAQGYRAMDRVFIPFGYNIFVAFWAGHYAAEKLGCEVVPGGVLDTTARLLDHHVVVSPGRAFGDGGEGYIRLALVPTLDECAEAAEAVVRCLK